MNQWPIETPVAKADISEKGVNIYEVHRARIRVHARWMQRAGFLEKANPVSHQVGIKKNRPFEAVKNVDLFVSFVVKNFLKGV